MAPTAAATRDQIEALLNFMSEHQELARGLLSGADGRARAKRLWVNLCNSLNSMGSCTKSVEQWQRVWADKKHLTKKAAGAASRSACATGGGPSVAPTLSQVELNILSIMGDGYGQPQTLSNVPSFPTGPPPVIQPAAMSPPHVATLADLFSQEQPSTSTEALEPAAPVPQWTTSGVIMATPELPMQNQRTLNPRRRVRRHLPADSARSRIVEVEEQRLLLEARRNELLSEIKVAIVELCTLVREHINKNN